MKRGTLTLLWILLTVATGVIHPQTIKLGALAPAGSPWHRGLEEIGADWSRLSGGRLKLKIYPGGIVGSEEDIVRKMRLGQLQAAAISAFGLMAIDSDVGSLLLPFMMQNDQELEYVLERMTPYFNAQFESQGFTIVSWISAGWFFFYSKETVVYPDDLRRQRLWVRQGDTHEIAAWRNAGFRVVPLQATDVLGSLNNGMIDACTVSPLAAISTQWFALTPNMCDMRVSPMIGAFVMSTRSMNRIRPDLRPSIVEASRRVTEQLSEEVSALDDEAMRIMQEHGLVVNCVPEAAEYEWQTAMRGSFQTMVGRSFSREAHELVQGYIAEFRESRERGGSER